MGTDKSGIDDALTRDVAYAVSRSLDRVKGEHRNERARIIASRVVEHLKLCRWQFDRKPPQELHGSFTKAVE
jgi:hypothetical protein